MKNFIRFTSLCGIVLLFPTGNTAAQTSGQCAIAPTCSELGYEQKATDCSGQYMLKCPFDNSKVFCGGDACTSDYTLFSCDSSKGTCDVCGGKYKYTSCSGNFTLSNGNCICNKSCNGGYSLDSSSCSCYCSISSCGSGQYLAGCACHSCASACGYARTSEPYTLEECRALVDNDSCYSPDSYVCNGTTYYTCRSYCGEMCWSEYYDNMW